MITALFRRLSFLKFRRDFSWHIFDIMPSIVLSFSLLWSIDSLRDILLSYFPCSSLHFYAAETLPCTEKRRRCHLGFFTSWLPPRKYHMMTIKIN